MENQYYTIAAVSFTVIALTLLVLLVIGVSKALVYTGVPTEKRRKKVLFTAIGLCVWLVFLAVLAARGFFTDFNAMPPRFMPALLPPIVFTVILCNSKGIGRLLDNIPSSWLVYIQSFRLPLEIILWLLFIGNIIPVEMTLEGRNWDIVTGITAIIVGWFCFTRSKWSPKVALWWNFMGLALVINIAVVSVLCAPVPFRVFTEGPANTMVTHVPFVWLPGFVVPIAYCMHFLSIRQLLRKK